MKNPPATAMAWSNQGKYIKWKSSLQENASFGGLNIFTVCLGEKTNPAIVMIHGYPTSSYDFRALADQLIGDAYICALDTPGYGFSDKPRGGYRYSIFDDAVLFDHFVREVLGLKEFTLLTHDKGDSVGLALLQIYQRYDVKPYVINQLVITNGNIYLPLARLTPSQKLLLNGISGPLLSSLASGSRIAKGMARLTYTPELTPEEVAALASILDYQDGSKVQHSIIQYLNERKENEIAWLETLGRGDVPTTLVWGELDSIAPVAVADYVWVNYLKERKAPTKYWRVPCANHYLQVDQPRILASLVKGAIGLPSKSNASPESSCRPYSPGA
jgi:pimeloyl-ACP methyl ester carboxylesterase